MAKRYQAPREFSRSFKKPKLDVSINKGRPIQKSLSADAPRPPTLSPNKDFWDDGDDDVLLLATQVAETAVNNRRTECSFAITESELTFSEFVPNAGSSTQRPISEHHVPNQDILSQIFDDDIDWGVEASGKNEKKFPGKQSSAELSNKDENVFKKPIIPVSNKSSSSDGGDDFKKPNEVLSLKPKGQSNNFGNVSQVSNSHSENEPEVLSQSAARRQLASERQIKFLMDRVDVMKKENQRLSVELDQNKSKITSKEGEISLLRDELKHTKQQMQNLKMERILTADAAKTECKTKIAQLSTQVEAKKAEAQLKALECMQLKMRHAEETQRFEMSMRSESMFFEELPQPAVNIEKRSIPRDRLDREVLRIRCKDLLIPKEDSVLVLSSTESFCNKRHTNFFYNETKEETIFKGISDQVIANQWQTLRIAAVNLQAAAKKQNLTINELDEYAKNSLIAISWILHELNHLAENLTVKNCRVYTYHNYELLKDFSYRTRQSLLQPTILYPSESAIELRRCIAALSVLTRNHTFLAKQIFSNVSENCNVDGELFLLSSAKRISRIGFSNELVQHFGLIEAFASLTHSLLLQTFRGAKKKDFFPEDWQYQIIYLLKEIIFTRPNPWILKEVSFCILLCANLPYCLTLLCQNAQSTAFRAEPIRSICEYTNASCILQVYSSLLEICFPLYTPITSKHFELLTVITLNHIRFVYFCFTKPPQFIHERLPIYDEDDEGVNANADETENATLNQNSNNITNNNNNENSSTNMYNSSSTTSTMNSSSNNSNSVTQQIQQQTLPNQKPRSAILTCECYHRLSISVVTLAYQVLYHWQNLDKSFNTVNVAQMSKILVQLLHTIFCDNYSTTLFKDSEDTTKHYLYLICKWMSENSKLLKFKTFHLNLIEKLKLSHIMPKHLKDEENIANITADLADWCVITNDKVDENRKNSDDKLLEQSADADKFFEGLKGYAYNFQ